MPGVRLRADRRVSATTWSAAACASWMTRSASCSRMMVFVVVTVTIVYALSPQPAFVLDTNDSGAKGGRQDVSRACRRASFGVQIRIGPCAPHDPATASARQASSASSLPIAVMTWPYTRSCRRVTSNRPMSRHSSQSLRTSVRSSPWALRGLSMIMKPLGLGCCPGSPCCVRPTLITCRCSGFASGGSCLRPAHGGSVSRSAAPRLRLGRDPESDDESLVARRVVSMALTAGSCQQRRPN